MVIINKIRLFVFNKRLKKSVNSAIMAHAATGKTYFVIRWKDRPLAISKRKLKEWIAAGKLRNINIATIEKTALYIAK
ncbi:MAG: hypothetical protein PHD07_08640 [Bacteroidales bacterium]|nr:hypothetical protein [Bacteroidales bacterium]MDD3201951.1 hypothetical protein [Bacteroidales bacterium]